MHQFHYDYIKKEYDNKSKLLFTHFEWNVYKDFGSDKETLDFSNYSTKSKHYNNWKKLVIGKMKDEILGVETETFVGLMPKMYSFLVDNNEHKKAKGANKNVAARISYNEYKNILLNKKCTRHSMNRIQS